MVCTAALLLAAPGVRSEEVTVKNDSFQDGGPAVIVGDFVAGEEAAAWLTSPCDGAIVAVQIAWLEATPGHGPSLEEAIHIYAAGSFPNPGTELETLEGPVMTPGAINEFRHLDQAQTIPLDVPVTQGQTFVVSLEFANPTDVGNDGPSVIRDWDGCQANRNALCAVPGLWIDWCSFPTDLPPKGDLVIRAVVDCLDPTGACCDAYGLCTNGVEQDECQDTGETFFEGLDCGEVTCPEPTGACCNGTGGCLVGQTQDFCENALSGIYAGHATTCADEVCDLGACCLPLGNCQEVIELACSDLGGAFYGPGSACATTECPQPTGSCCVGEICVADQTEANCLSFEGQWQGAFSDCGPPNPCLGQGCPCGDINESGGLVDLQDFGLLALCFGYGGPAGDCTAAYFECSDLDGSGLVDLQDFGLFALWYGGQTSQTPPNCEPP